MPHVTVVTISQRAVANEPFLILMMDIQFFTQASQYGFRVRSAGHQ
jgi:hypothetical protein